MEDKKYQVRLKDVALKAGVSETTASMAFTGNGRISDETKNHILSTAKELGYSIKKKSTKRKKSDSAGLLLSIDKSQSFMWFFLTEMIDQLQDDLKNLGLKLAIIPVSGNETPDTVLAKISSFNCSAIFSIGLVIEELFVQLEEENIPVILLLNNNYQNKYFSVCVDDFRGAYDGTKYLLEQGHKNIYFVDDFRENLPTLSSDRYFGYRKALEEARIPFRDEFKISCDMEYFDSEIKELKLVLDKDNSPTAFFCLDDEVALRMHKALHKLGYKVPEDISLIAVGDLQNYDKPYIPQITTMKIDMKNLAMQAVSMLKNRLHKDSDNYQFLSINSKLIIRDSIKNI